jgi:hypothetical protein
MIHTTAARRLNGANGVMSSRCPRWQLARNINSNSQIALQSCF